MLLEDRKELDRILDSYDKIAKDIHLVSLDQLSVIIRYIIDGWDYKGLGCGIEATVGKDSMTMKIPNILAAV